MKGIIFDIKRYAIHDGPGIRSTVFFKGCSLRCLWCHNPEGLESGPEIFYRKERCPAACRLCLAACPEDALKKTKGVVTVDLDRCDFCGDCEKACVYEAIEIVGRPKSISEVMDEIVRDSVFYEESRGGVTFSGGEPLEQIDFLEALLIEAKKKGLHTTVDTCGNYPQSSLERIYNLVDVFLYDLKMIDDVLHKKYTGFSNRFILENLKFLAAEGTSVVVRIPLIAGINDDDRNILATADFLLSLQGIDSINLLPYHSGGEMKYLRLGKENRFAGFRAPAIEKIDHIKSILENKGFRVKTGG